MSTKRLSEEEISRAMEDCSWTRDKDAIERTFVFGNFQQAFAFLTRVAILAEKDDHHPEIWNVYNKVRLLLTTHDAGGLTTKDFGLAARIDDIISE